MIPQEFDSKKSTYLGSGPIANAIDRHVLHLLTPAINPKHLDPFFLTLEHISVAVVLGLNPHVNVHAVFLD